MDEHQLNDLLECSVCLDRLDTSSKVLPCQHTFCRKCLEVIVSSRQELRCPECRILVDIKIDELPPNVLLMRILEGMKNAAAAKTQQQQQQKQQPHYNDSNKLEEAQKLNQEQQQQIKLKQQQQQQQQQKQMLQYQQQQQFKQQQQQAAVLQQQQQHVAANNAQRRLLLPHAFALYDFESAEPSDLHFKKGDLVLLRRKIDINWYVGQLNGVEGTFPINYVQVIVPLPTPHAIALYDFKMGPNEEEGCLTFRKGTPINVLRRVDHNWAEGRIGSNIGIFPIAFVELNALAKQLLDSFLLQPNAAQPATQPVTQQPQQQPQPQPQSQPQPNATQPLPNTAATTAATTAAAATISATQTQPPRNLPPIPLIDPTTNLNPSDSNTSSSNSSSNTTSPHSTTTTTCSSSISSNSIPSSPNQTQPNTPQHVVANVATTVVDSATSSTTAAPAAAAATTNTTSAVRYRDCKEKRHSLNALLSAGSGSGSAAAPALSILQSNRHSAEILSVPSELSQPSPPPQSQHTRQRSAAADVLATVVVSSPSSSATAAAPQSTVAREQQHAQLAPPPAAARINVLKSCGPQNVPPSMPWGYLALYPYKPHKGDELELKKGCVYIVTERCLDGWFKGKNWQDASGVFPGNYVTPLRQRDHQQLMHQWKFVPQQQQQQPQQQQPSQSNVTTTAAAKTQNHLENINTRLVGGSGGGGSGGATTAMIVPGGLPHQPPDLPPRQITAGSVWTHPLGHTVEAFFNRCSNKTPPTAAAQNETKDSKEKETSTVAAATATVTATPSTSSSSASAAVSLMKRLTHIKSRSKSPGSAIVAAANNSNSSAATQQPPHSHTSTSTSHTHAQLNNYAMDNPTFEDASHCSSNSATHAPMHPVHVRSGSCPSQLLQSLPIELTTLQINEGVLNHQQHPQQQQQQHKPQVLPQATYGSQRVKGSKERPQLQNIRQSMDGTFRSGTYNNTIAPPQLQPLAQQQPQQPATANILLTKCGQQQKQQQQQQQQQQIQTNLIHHHRKSQSLDANTLTAAPPVAAPTATTATAAAAATTTVAPPPTNATAGPCNISAAAIAASATTKSTQNTRESRFRCVVPYPPNSDIELELQFGDLIYVHRKQKNGWYKGTHARTNKTGLFPASFVEPDI